MSFFNFFLMDLAIDLGTANTIIMVEGDVVVDEPSLIAIDKNSDKLLAIGHEALKMYGKTPDNIVVLKPLKDGVIANYRAAEIMITEMIKRVNKIRKKTIFSSFDNVVVCIPSDITDVEKRAIRDSTIQTGARNVLMIYEPIAAAIGAGLDIVNTNANMIVDIGGGTTEIAIITLSNMVCFKSVRIAGNVFNQNIIDYVRKNYNVIIGEATAEKAKKSIGSVFDQIDTEQEYIDIYGRNMIIGTPTMVKMTNKDISIALDKSIALIEETILQILEQIPPELSSDLYANGITLTGGGALLKGLDKRLSERIGLDIHVAEDPLKAVVKGVDTVLKDRKIYKDVFVK